MVSSPHDHANWPQCEKDDQDCANKQLESDDDEDEESEIKVASCETLRMCILTTLNWGLRNGGGIGDILRKNDPDEQLFIWRIMYGE